MSNVEFDDNQRELLYAQMEEINKPKGFQKMFIDQGWAKDEKEAGQLLGLVAVIFLCVTAYVIFKFLI